MNRLDWRKTFGWMLELTDEVGLIQHSVSGIPNRAEGYSTDDVARALVVWARIPPDCQREHSRVARTYLAFVEHARTDGGGVHNFLGYDRRWRDKRGSEDCVGRVLWGTGTFAAESSLPGLAAASQAIFQNVLSSISRLSAPRALAFSILGLGAYLSVRDDPSVRDWLARAAQKLEHYFRMTSSPGWRWFENYLTYENARLPQAMLVAGRVTGNREWIQIGKQSLDFLMGEVFDEVFAPVGNQGWYYRGWTKAEFDQQPVEAGATAEALAEASQLGLGKEYEQLCRRTLGWYFGENVQGVPLVEEETGAVYDALTREGINQNQGAEACLSFLLGVLAWLRLQQGPQDEACPAMVGVTRCELGS